MAECLPSICTALDSIPSMANTCKHTHTDNLVSVTLLRATEIGGQEETFATRGLQKNEVKGKVFEYKIQSLRDLTK